MRFAVVRFPGTWSDRDCVRVLRDVLGQPAEIVWHRESDLSGFDAVVLPGGFSYGDYLRCGSIARFSPVMAEVIRLAASGAPIIGICNGFQILCESGLLPGALMRNSSLQFRCEWTHLECQSEDSPWLARVGNGTVLRIPISHGEGSYFADAATLEQLTDEERIAFRYCEADGSVTASANPNGSVGNVAGILNEDGNVLGLMPHPERAGESIVGGEDGNRLWTSLIETVSG